MADPLCITASIVGNLTAAAQVTVLLQGVISKSKHAPDSIRTLVTEVNAISGVFVQLQKYILRKTGASPSRTAMILVDQVLIVLSTSVLTFLELETLAKSFGTDELGLRIVCAGESQLKAEAAVGRLTNLVEQLLRTNQIIEQRLYAADLTSRMYRTELAVDKEEEESGEPTSGADHAVIVPVNDIRATVFTYTDELQASWVYRRNYSRQDTPLSSICSTAGRTASWSMLSGISLSQISSIAVLALPINRDDIENHERYVFGSSENDQRHVPSLEEAGYLKAVKALDDRRFSANLSGQGLGRLLSLRSSGSSFGLPLEKMPLVPSKHWTTIGLSLMVPYAVHLLGAYLEANGECVSTYGYRGQNKQDLFVREGDPTAVRKLEQMCDMITSDTPRDTSANQASTTVTNLFLRGVNAAGCSTSDVASCFLSYLKKLKAPLIPGNCFDDYRDGRGRLLMCGASGAINFPDSLNGGLGNRAAELARRPLALRAILRAQSKMYPRIFDLLHYMLNIIAHVALGSALPLTTVQSLVFILQPYIFEGSGLSRTFPDERKSFAIGVITMMVVRNSVLREVPGPEQQKISERLASSRSERDEYAHSWGAMKSYGYARILDTNIKRLEENLVEEMMKPRDAVAPEASNSHASDEQPIQGGSQEPSDMLDFIR